MAPETIALAGVISSGLVGLAAIGFTALGGWRGSGHDPASDGPAEPR